MAEEIKMHKQLAAPLLPPPVETKKQQHQAHASPPFPAARLVSLWGLYNSGVVALTFVFIHTLNFIKSCVWDLPPWVYRPLEMTDAEDARASALLLASIWCTVAQAAAAAPALLLAGHRCRRIRRALAYVVLAAAVASHCMHASAVRIILVAADPGYNVVNRILAVAPIFVFAVGDLVCFLALLVGSEE